MATVAVAVTKEDNELFEFKNVEVLRITLCPVVCGNPCLIV